MKRWIALLIGVLIVVAVWYFAGASMQFTAAAENERWLRSVVADHPVVSVGVGVIIYVLTSLIPGTTGKSIVFGWLFGFWIGLAIVSFSLATAAVLAMLTVRRFFRDWAVRRAPRIVENIDRALRRGGEATCLMTLRLVHAPYTGINYSAGATRVRVSTFAWTTLLGMLPSNMVFVLAGSRLPSLERFDEIKLWDIVSWQLLLGSTLAIAIPLVVKRLIGDNSAKENCEQGGVS
ncbi:TVP38/TMEM64 family protein [Aporhodopirellula aestuarii]|uniref:TVP38/TMEM64 family membrane protein n=1 Tax=Aporhodopirellula aestuarii TaxID=2950107 RepID=A0ABT0U0B8_9BACT|nr:VTT domain-containing protein [Aporhodopirellula aestuarii]MCM2370309.1 VTT domain-containing protein [Aporhodopirellula aestuarii]